MPDVEQYDAIVLGTGEAGKYDGLAFGRKGQTGCRHRAQIPRRCLPKHSLPAQQERGSWSQGRLIFPERRRVRHAGRQVDRFHAGRTSAQTANGRRSSQMHQDNFARSKAEIVMGEGRFIADRDPESLTIRGRRAHSPWRQVFINTGTRAKIPNLPGLTEASPLTHVEALELDIVPEHLLILGGGYVGWNLPRPCGVWVAESLSWNGMIAWSTVRIRMFPKR